MIVNNCPTEHISAFLDEHLKPYVQNILSYVQHTTDFMNKLEDFSCNNQIILEALDVTSLYTNIPNQEGINAVYRTLLRNHRDIPYIGSLIKLFKVVLHYNNFTFFGENYLQVGGTDMGTKLAPTYPNIFMGELEQKLLKNAQVKPLLYLR